MLFLLSSQPKLVSCLWLGYSDIIFSSSRLLTSPPAKKKNGKNKSCSPFSDWFLLDPVLLHFWKYIALFVFWSNECVFKRKSFRAKYLFLPYWRHQQTTCQKKVWTFPYGWVTRDLFPSYLVGFRLVKRQARRYLLALFKI